MATITITPGNSFTATETVTSTKLNDLGSPTAALTAASIDTADIADDAVTPALIADDAVTTPAILDANVTFAKLTDVIDDDTMATATDTTLATSESIKAYVDTSKTSSFTPSAYIGVESVTLPNGLIMKFGYKATVATNDTISFDDDFPTACINVSATTAEANSTARWPMKVSSLNVGSFKIKHGNSTITNHGAYWQAIGY
jgi:hypothetical protein